MFSITLGKKGLKNTWQSEFPEETKCLKCGAAARIGFVAKEAPEEGSKHQEFVCSLHKNDPDGKVFWLHDCCAVAVYFCKGCLEPTALYNQA